MSKIKNSYNVFASFFITSCIIISIYFLYEVYPFGNNCILWFDLAAQYSPFFDELFDRLKNGQSLIYSFSLGLGLPFLGNFFNYLSTPLLFLIFLFDRSEIPTAIALMILLKSSFSAATFTYYLKKSQDNKSIIASGFGVMYSLSGWFVAYYFDIMWLDAVAFLPLVILGIEKIINDGKPYTYIAFLSLTLITNYYMGYMVCIFSVIYYIVYYFSKYDFKSNSGGKIKNLFINRSISFGISSLCCGAIAAFSLIPVFIILRSSSATSESWPDSPELYFNFWNFFANHFVDAVPSFSNDFDLIPNIYCGILTLILIPVFFFSKKISTKEKIIYGLLVVFLYFSFNINYLDFIWHAFHFPNDMPYRFSYIYCFVLLIMAYRALCCFETVKIPAIVFSAILIFTLIILTKHFGINVEKQSFQFSLVFVVIYLVLLVLINKPKIKNSVSFFLFVAIITEVLCADSGNFEIYLSKDKYLANYDEVRTLNQQISDSDTENFYRIESTITSLTNGGSGYGYNGVSSFTSMGYESIAKIQDRLGIESNKKNSFHYLKQTPVYNMMHDIKYVSSGKDTNYFSEIYKSGNFSAYKNDYYLPLGFCVDSSIVEWNIENKNPFEVQNEWFRLATGMDNALVGLNEEKIVSQGLSDVEYDKSSGSVKYKKEKNAEKSTATVSFVANDTCCYSFSEIKDRHTKDYVVEQKEIKSGDIIELTVDINDRFDDEGTAYVCAYTVNEEALNKGYEKLKSQVMTIDTFDETYIKGSVTAKEDCVLYTSIPFDKGWTVSIDGKEINEDDYIALGNAYLCFNISQGDHTVEFSFRQRGLKEGISISVITLVSLIVYAVIKKKNDDSIKSANAQV